MIIAALARLRHLLSELADDVSWRAVLAYHHPAFYTVTRTVVALHRTAADRCSVLPDQLGIVSCLLGELGLRVIVLLLFTRPVINRICWADEAFC